MFNLIRGEGVCVYPCRKKVLAVNIGRKAFHSSPSVIIGQCSLLVCTDESFQQSFYKQQKLFFFSFYTFTYI